jgi:four helix bundle protein
MQKANPIVDKSYLFALIIVKTCRTISEQRKEWILSRQLLRSGTSIGANIEEAVGAQSKKDFIAKFSIAYKETRETNYWLRLLHDSGYLLNEQFEPLIENCNELSRMLSSIILTSTSKSSHS